MTGKTHRIRRMVKAFALAASVAAFAVPVAQAGSPQVDDWFRDGLKTAPASTHGNLGIVDDSWRSAALKVSAPASNPIVDDYFRDGLKVATPGVANRIVDDSFRDGLKVATPNVSNPIVDDYFRDGLRVSTPGVSTRIVDDYFRDAPAAAASGNGFDWGDLGIGIAGGAALLLLLTGLAVGMREARHQQRLGSA
jgi:hypothetical protein